MATAASLSYNGIQGHLATITSAEENQFITTVLESYETGKYYIGGSDSEVEGLFKWIDGPEAGSSVTYTNWWPESFGSGVEPFSK